jgi:hypothetical protein
VSEENRLYAQFPRGPFTFISWLPDEPANFHYSEPNEQATGFAPPYEALRKVLSGYGNFESNKDYLSNFAVLGAGFNPPGGGGDRRGRGMRQREAPRRARG